MLSNFSSLISELTLSCLSPPSVGVSPPLIHPDLYADPACLLLQFVCHLSCLSDLCAVFVLLVSLLHVVSLHILPDLCADFVLPCSLPSDLYVTSPHNTLIFVLTLSCLFPSFSWYASSPYPP